MRALSPSEIMDVTARLIIEKGSVNLTLVDISQAAGVSRMTLYRRWDSRDRLLVETVEREMRHALDELVQAVTRNDDPEHPMTGRQLLVEILISGLHTIGSNPVVREVYMDSPETLMNYQVTRTGRTQSSVLTVIEEYLQRGFDDGSIPRRPRQAAAYLLLFTLQSLVSSRQLLEQETDSSEVENQLRLMVDAYLGAQHSTTTTAAPK